jgi:hypothetical protein
MPEMVDPQREEYPDTYEACPVGGEFKAYGDGKTYEKIQVGESDQGLNRESKKLVTFFPGAKVKILSRPDSAEPDEDDEDDDK